MKHILIAIFITLAIPTYSYAVVAEDCAARVCAEGEENCDNKTKCGEDEKCYYISDEPDGPGCAACQPGYSCSGGELGAECVVGTYAAVGDGVCNPCTDNLVQPLTGQDGCISCPAGATPNTDRTACSATCTVANSDISNVETVSGTIEYTYEEKGNWLPFSSNYDWTETKNCTVEECNLGYYINDNKCTECPENSYCADGINATTCYDKNNIGFTTKEETGSTSESDCKYMVDDGYGLTYTNNTYSLSPCGAGKYNEGKEVSQGDTHPCQTCTDGYFTNNNSAKQCAVCPGTVSDNHDTCSMLCNEYDGFKPEHADTITGDVSWTADAAGTATANTSDCKVTKCAIGYGIGEDKQSCYECEEDEFSIGTQCTKCGENAEPKTDNAGCRCKAGYYNMDDKYSCSACPEHKWYDDDENSTTCVDCAAGFYCGGDGTKIECPAGSSSKAGQGCFYAGGDAGASDVTNFCDKNAQCFTLPAGIVIKYQPAYKVFQE